ECAEGHGELRARRAIIGPEPFEVRLHFDRERCACRKLDRDVRFQVVVGEIASREIRRTERCDEAIAAAAQRELRVKLLAVRAVPANLDLPLAPFDAFISDGAVGIAVLASTESIAIRIENQTNSNGANGGIEQWSNDLPVGHVERGDVDRIGVARGANLLE